MYEKCYENYFHSTFSTHDSLYMSPLFCLFPLCICIDGDEAKLQQWLRLMIQRLKTVHQDPSPYKRTVPRRCNGGGGGVERCAHQPPHLSGEDLELQLLRADSAGAEFSGAEKGAGGPIFGHVHDVFGPGEGEKIRWIVDVDVQQVQHGRVVCAAAAAAAVR
jgi:hypothetical protein